MTALYAIAHGMGSTAPAAAVRRFEECRLLERLNWAWTFDELRHTRAGDYAFLLEYLVMTQPMKEERADG